MPDLGLIIFVLVLCLAHPDVFGPLVEKLGKLAFPHPPETPSDPFLNQQVPITKTFTFDPTHKAFCGRVRIGNETWNARCSSANIETMNVGELVLLTRVRELDVDVERIEN